MILLILMIFVNVLDMRFDLRFFYEGSTNFMKFLIFLCKHILDLIICSSKFLYVLYGVWKASLKTLRKRE